MADLADPTPVVTTGPTDPAAVCACGHARWRHAPTAGLCGGHHRSGGSTGMVQQCGCQGWESMADWRRRTAGSRAGAGGVL